VSDVCFWHLADINPLLGNDFYFADVSTLAGYNSYITILNPPTGTVATITVTYYFASAIQGTDTLVVQPGTRGTIIPRSLNTRAATWVHSDQPVVVERPTYFNNYSYGNAQHVYGSATVVGAPKPATDWRFAEGYIGGQFQENLVLANFGSTGASGTLVMADARTSHKSIVPRPGPGMARIELSEETTNGYFGDG